MTAIKITNEGKRCHECKEPVGEFPAELELGLWPHVEGKTTRWYYHTKCLFKGTRFEGR